MSGQYVVLYTGPAKEDLKAIYRYIADELFAVNAARRQVKQIKDRIGDLCFFPNRFKIAENKTLNTNQIHIMPVNHFAVLYRIDEDELKVYIIRILYQRRDFEAVISDSTSGFVSDVKGCQDEKRLQSG